LFEFTSVLDASYDSYVVNRVYSQVGDSIRAIASGDSTNTSTAASIISNLSSAEIAGSQQAARNASDGISTLQVFDNAVSAISSKLTGMVGLATKADNGTYSDTQKYVMQLEFEELADEINDIVRVTEFNGNRLLSSDGKALSISLGGSTIDIDAQDLSLDITELDLTTDASSALAFAKQATEQTSTYSGYLSSKIHRLEQTAAVIQFDTLKAMGFQTSISNTDLAREIAAEVMGKIMTEATILLGAQAKLEPSRALHLLQWGFAGATLY
jgi:flagellin